MQVVARLDERVGGHDREFKSAREQRSDDVAAMTRAFENVDKSCGEKVLSVKREFHEEIGIVKKELGAVKKAIADAAAAAERKRERNEWTLTQKLALFSATFSPFVGALIVVLTK